jgi:hypothetical protein
MTDAREDVEALARELAAYARGVDDAAGLVDLRIAALARYAAMGVFSPASKELHALRAAIIALKEQGQ